MSNQSSSPTESHKLHVQQLFVRHQQLVLGYVLSLEPNFADAQDIVQEVFLKVSDKAMTWTRDTDFAAWVCTFARYEFLHFQRTRARRKARLDDDVVELLASELPDESAFHQRVSALQRCLGKLSPRAKELIVRRYHLSQLPEQIAPEIGWTMNAVNVGLTRARQVLRKCVNQQIASDEIL